MKRKLKSVTYSMYFKVKEDTEPEYMWSMLHKWDKMKPEAFCEHARDSWYDWHGFLSRKSLKEAIPSVFEAFPEVESIEIYKDIYFGAYGNNIRREIVRREEYAT